MATYDEYRLDPGKDPDSWPPGDTTYPQVVPDFFTINEAYALELQNARENTTSLLENLTTNYIDYILEDYLNGSYIKRCTNMLDGVADTDYATVKQSNIELEVLTVDEVTPDSIDSTPAGLFHASDEYRISSDGLTIDTMDFRSIDPSVATTYLYPYRYNATYYIDWSLYSGKTSFKLNAPEAGLTPVVGDRIRIYMYSAPSNCTIDASLIMNETTFNITEGASYVYIELVFTSQVGWYLVKHDESIVYFVAPFSGRTFEIVNCKIILDDDSWGIRITQTEVPTKRPLLVNIYYSEIYHINFAHLDDRIAKAIAGSKGDDTTTPTIDLKGVWAFEAGSQNWTDRWLTNAVWINQDIHFATSSTRPAGYGVSAYVTAEEQRPIPTTQLITVGPGKDYQTIEAAIVRENPAPSPRRHGDNIIIYPGTYEMVTGSTENIDYQVSFWGATGDPDDVIISFDGAPSSNGGFYVRNWGNPADSTSGFYHITFDNRSTQSEGCFTHIKSLYSGFVEE